MKKKLNVNVRKQDDFEEHPLYKKPAKEKKSLTIRKGLLLAIIAGSSFLMLTAGFFIGKQSVQKSPYSDYMLYQNWRSSLYALEEEPESITTTGTEAQPVLTTPKSAGKTTETSSEAVKSQTAATASAVTTASAQTTASSTAVSTTETTVSSTAAPTEPADLLSDDAAVWVSSKGGTKYHTKPDCSGMSSPNELTLKEAVSKGYSPCKRCN